MLLSKNSIPIWAAVIGNSTAGPSGEVVDVLTLSDLTQFGSGSLVNCAKVLLGYGVSVMAIRLGNFDTLAALPRVPTAVIYPETSAAIDSFVAACQSNQFLGIIDFVGDFESLQSARAGSTGYGTKSRFLAITYPAITVGSEVQYLSSHLGSLICREVQRGEPLDGEFMRGASGVTIALRPDEADWLIQHGVVTVLWPNLVIRGFSNSLMYGETTQDTPLMRTVVENSIIQEVRGYLSTQIGTPVNLETARGMASIISATLAAREDITGGKATLQENLCTFTPTSASLAFRIDASLKVGTTLTLNITFQP